MKLNKKKSGPPFKMVDMGAGWGEGSAAKFANGNFKEKKFPEG